jgi:hypothetical protein
VGHHRRTSAMRAHTVLTFNQLLHTASIDPDQVRLLRHKDGTAGRDFRSLYAAWKSAGGQVLIEDYQCVQNTPKFTVGGYVAGFIATPAPSSETVFIGLYSVQGLSTCPPGMSDPYRDMDVAGKYLYDLRRDERFDIYRDRLVIDWGDSARAWAQWAGRQDKPILAIRDAVVPPFPGPGEFTADVDTIPALPSSWREFLQNTRGIYLLVDKDDGRSYVGSAKGADSFWGRWTAYAQNGNGGNLGMKERSGRRYQVCILQVVDAEQTDRTIEQLEARWKRKLMTREHGLNKN